MATDYKDYVVTADEALAVGLTAGSHLNKWADIVKPLLIAKGIPEEDLFTGSMKVIPLFSLDWSAGEFRFRHYT